MLLKVTALTGEGARKTAVYGVLGCLLTGIVFC